ncbi:endonuclease/exonuclease/phosphatase family protein [Nocardiopsis suaedae]|uniref:Endonuclease/exonuclease/phosphatase family protein n=1 Tax=Nocardiopsis suaedae TaxID=3018444 RepID=A0ABT4TT84_9ACTN|nr:endonuclease/exonuclease/phosphatase family protein [Nocardiopsis suaedae]MDA2807894.1 endonuclease/exonuclease/phosphatase family protein [Nocardiopsis suaedae]
MAPTPRLPLPRAVRPLTAVALSTALAASGGAAALADAAPRIHEIQGTTRLSPFDGREVAGVTGTVTAVNAFGSARGFWFQDPEGDGDPRTSEALFVFTGRTTPGVAPGDTVAVGGRVQEYSPGDGLQTVTQVADASWEVTGRAEVPAPVALEPGTVPAGYAPEGDDISGYDLEPGTFALDYWESREHMVVRVEDARTVGPTDDYNGLWVTTEPDRNASPRGGTVYSGYDDPNPGRLKVESLIPSSERPFPQVNTGDELAGPTQGPLYYTRFGGYVLKAAELGEHVDHGLERTAAEPAEDWELSAAAYNVENLSPEDDQAKFDRLGEGIAEGLAAPAIVSLEEVQDDSGPTDDGTVSAERTLEMLTGAVEAAGGPSYEWRLIDPEDKRDGGQPGGNIRNALLFDPERVSFTDRPGGDATTPVEVVGEGGDTHLSVSPGRIAPKDAAWENSRKPLVGEFSFEGRPVFVVTDHFASKGGDEALHGTAQPPERSSEVQRHAQAELVRGFVDDLQAADPDANVLVVGDLNDFWFSETLGTLTDGGALHNPMEDLPAEERYTYVYDGNSQALDHVLVSGAVADRARLDIVRLNSEFHDQVSDHDPQVVRFRPLSGDPKTDRKEHKRWYGGPGKGHGNGHGPGHGHGHGHDRPGRG